MYNCESIVKNKTFVLLLLFAFDIITAICLLPEKKLQKPTWATK